MDQDLDLCSACLCFGTSKPGDMVWSIGVHSSGSLDVMAMMNETWIQIRKYVDLDLNMCSVCLCFGTSKSGCMSVFWDLKIWRQILLVNKVLKGALDVIQMMAPESRSTNLWIRTWICAVCCFVFGTSKGGLMVGQNSKGPWMRQWRDLNPDPLICGSGSGPGFVPCVRVFGDLKSLCKDRIEREASQAYPKRASLPLPCVALRSLCGREAFSSSPMQLSIVKSSAPSGTFRSTFLYSLYATSARNRNLLLWSSRTGYYWKKPLRD